MRERIAIQTREQLYKMGDISTDNDNSAWENELSSIIDRTSTVLKKGRVSSARHAWGTTSQAVGSTTSSSVGVATHVKNRKLSEDG